MHCLLVESNVDGHNMYARESIFRLLLMGIMSMQESLYSDWKGWAYRICTRVYVQISCIGIMCIQESVC